MPPIRNEWSQRGASVTREGEMDGCAIPQCRVAQCIQANGQQCEPRLSRLLAEANATLHHGSRETSTHNASNFCLPASVEKIYRSHTIRRRSEKINPETSPETYDERERKERAREEMSSREDGYQNSSPHTR